LNPKKQVEAKELLSAVLEVISTLKEKFKADYIVNILVGNDEFLQFLQVLISIESDTLAFSTVPTGTTGFLVITF